MINKIWKKVRLFLYIKLAKLELKLSKMIVKYGDFNDRVNLLKIYLSIIEAPIHNKYPKNVELRKLKLKAMGYALGICALGNHI